MTPPHVAEGPGRPTSPNGSGYDREALVRRLRATAVVNAQLRAQIEASSGSGGTAAAVAVRAAPTRRSGVADGWVDELLAGDGVGGEPRLVTDPSGLVHLVEGTLRRAVRAGLVVAALEGAFGRAAPIDDEELGSLHEGPAVEVLEAPTGPPFVVVAGRRHELRGLPVPYPVAEEAVTGLPAGDELRVGAAPGRAAAAPGRPGSTAPPSLLDRSRRRVGRVRRAVRRRGVGGSLRALVRRVTAAV